MESLEADNFHDDPHADLVMSKKALNLFQEVQHSPEKSSTSLSNSQLGGASNLSSGSTSKSSKRRLKTAEYYKQRYVWKKCSELVRCVIKSAVPSIQLIYHFSDFAKIFFNYSKKMQYKMKNQKINVLITYRHKLLHPKNHRGTSAPFVAFHQNIAVQFVVLDFAPLYVKKHTRKRVA